MRSLVISLTVLAGFLSYFVSAARSADLPQTLTIDDLVGHPERWPATVTVNTNINSRGQTVIRKGQKVLVLEVIAKGIYVDHGSGSPVGVPTAGCDLLEQANEKWSQLTPAQRELDAKSVMADASLWPDTVKTRRPVKVDGPMGLSKTFPAGTPLVLAVYDEQGVYLQAPGLEGVHPNLKFEGTDLIESARQRILIDPAQRNSRIIDGVRNIMLDSSGKPYSNPNLDQTKVFVLYYGANWCQPCHQFSPTLVKFVNENGPKNPHMTVIMLNGDEKDAEMLKYLQDDKMPWPVMRMSDWKKVPVLAANQREGWPQLLITDRWGKIIYNEVGGGPSDIKLHTEALNKLNDSGTAR